MKQTTPVSSARCSTPCSRRCCPFSWALLAEAPPQHPACPGRFWAELVPKRSAQGRCQTRRCRAAAPRLVLSALLFFFLLLKKPGLAHVALMLDAKPSPAAPGAVPRCWVFPPLGTERSPNPGQQHRGGFCLLGLCPQVWGGRLRPGAGAVLPAPLRPAGLLQ